MSSFCPSNLRLFPKSTVTYFELATPSLSGVTTYHPKRTETITAVLPLFASKKAQIQVLNQLQQRSVDRASCFCEERNLRYCTITAGMGIPTFVDASEPELQMIFNITIAAFAAILPRDNPAFQRLSISTGGIRHNIIICVHSNHSNKEGHHLSHLDTAMSQCVVV